MLTDAHCHPFDCMRRVHKQPYSAEPQVRVLRAGSADLEKKFSGVEAERRRLGVVCAASASSAEEFTYHEDIARRAKAENAPPLLSCFALHPQLPAAAEHNGGRVTPAVLQEGLVLLDTLAAQGRLAAIGETGFDLYNAVFRETEKIQDELFAAHLETALRYDLPLVLHVRRGMHKIFAYAGVLKKCRTVIFHSWSGTAGEGEALLKRGINAFFSFGTTILLNHREAMRCCSEFHLTRMLVETDAPYQPLRGKTFSSWQDLPLIIRAVSALRGETGGCGPDAGKLENIIEKNFFAAFKE